MGVWGDSLFLQNYPTDNFDRIIEVIINKIETIINSNYEVKNKESMNKFSLFF